MTAAVGTSLAVIALTSALAAHLATGRIDWSIATAFAAAATAGALPGRRLRARLDQRRLCSLFATLLVGVATLLLIENASALGKRSLCARGGPIVHRGEVANRHPR